MVDRCEDVCRLERAFDRELRFRIGGSDDDSAFEAAAGHHHGDRVSPVVSAGDGDAGLAVVDLRSAAELAHHDDERAVENAAHVEVVDESGDGAIDRFQFAAVPFFDVRVIVPVRHIDGGERRTRLDQSPSHQRVSTPRVVAVLVDRLWVFEIEIERLASLPAQHHRERILLIPVDRLHQARLIGLPLDLIEAVEQRLTISRTGFFQFAKTVEALRPAEFPLGVIAQVLLLGVHIERVVGRTEIRGSHVARKEINALSGRQSDIRWHPRDILSAQLGNVRTERRILLRQAGGVRAESPGQHPVATREVVAVVVMHRADERHLVGELRVQRQCLGDDHAWHIGLQRSERPAIIGRRVRFWIIRFQLTRASIEPDQDDRFVVLLGRAVCSQPQQVAEA